MKLDMDPYWLDSKSVKMVEEKYGAKFMGAWCTKTKGGFWSEYPVDVFYQPNPDRSKGHSNYFGIFFDGHDSLRVPYITNAESAFSEPIYGVAHEEEVLVSRCRHDYRAVGNVMIDGGRDYIRHGGNAPLIRVLVKEDKFEFVMETKNDTSEDKPVVRRSKRKSSVRTKKPRDEDQV